MSRAVQQLALAEPCARPPCIPRSRPRGVKQLGLKFERGFGKQLPRGTLHGPWFKYIDNGQQFYCQPDHILPLDHVDLIFECKLTDCEAARQQLTHLYLPVVSRARKRPAHGIVVARHLTNEPKLQLVVTDLRSAMQMCAKGLIPTLHWIGGKI